MAKESHAAHHTPQHLKGGAHTAPRQPAAVVRREHRRSGGNAREIYDRFLPYVEASHQTNQKRIKVGIWILFLLPVILVLILTLTGSSRIAFLIIWIFCMFALAVFLVFTAYADSQLKKALNEMQTMVPDAEDELDGLMQRPGLPENMESRLSELSAAMESMRAQLQQRREKETDDAEHLDDHTD